METWAHLEVILTDDVPDHSAHTAAVISKAVISASVTAFIDFNSAIFFVRVLSKTMLL